MQTQLLGSMMSIGVLPLGEVIGAEAGSKAQVAAVSARHRVAPASDRRDAPDDAAGLVLAQRVVRAHQEAALRFGARCGWQA